MSPTHLGLLVMAYLCLEWELSCGSASAHCRLLLFLKGAIVWMNLDVGFEQWPEFSLLRAAATPRADQP